jgi:hypothetical protein
MRRRFAIRPWIAALALAACAAAMPLASGAQSRDELETRIERERGRERSLAGGAAELGRLIARLDRDVALLERRRAAVAGELARARAELERTRASLRRQRARAATLRVRLIRDRRMLARRLVELYQAGRPDLVTVILSADGFADLLERREFLRRIRDQDERIVRAVGRARAAARRAAQRLTRLERGQERAAAAIELRRDAAASLAEAVAAKRARLARARAARLAALRHRRGARRRLERELDALRADEGSSGSRLGPSGRWAIPWAVVQCESGGQNLPPNHAGASGYYQIIPSTWKGFGGRTDHAYQASKAEQDRVAARIWRNGAGAHNWVCWSLVR